MKSIFLITASVLLSLSAYSQAKKTIGNLPVKDGDAGVYIFTGNGPGNSAKPGKIYRSAGDRKDYKLVGEPQPAATEEAFKKLAGASSLATIARLKNLKDEHEAFAYVGQHPDIKEYGLGALNIGFLRAMGVCFLDEEAKSNPAGTKLFYKVEYSGGGDKTSEVEGDIVLGVKPAIAKPALSKLREQDSALIITWTAPAATSQDAFLARVLREKGNSGVFEKAGYVLAQPDDKNRLITYQWTETVTPGIDYNYVLVPATLTELSGPASDTTHAISHDFRSTEIIYVNKIKDTTNGIYLSWNEIRNRSWYSGILIERNRKTGAAFEPLDTVDVGSSSYIDTRVIPGMLYNYRLRFLTIRQGLGDPGATFTCKHVDRNMMPANPKELKATIDPKGVVKLSWQKSEQSVVAGYMVYRLEDDKWRLVSNQQKQTAFSDTITTQVSGDYKYMVRAISYSEVQSMPSDPVFVHWINTKPTAAAPTAFTGYAEPGRAILIWRDIRNTTNELVSYNVYRKTGKTLPSKEIASSELAKNGFEKISREPVMAASYTDNTVKEGEDYVYVVAGLSSSNIEGMHGTFLVLSVGTLDLGEPAGISARTTSAGIVVDWGRVLQDKVEGYEIYRRNEQQEEPVKIGKVTAKEDSYTDKTAAPGTLYFYSVKAVGKTGASRRTEERGIRL